MGGKRRSNSDNETDNDSEILESEDEENLNLTLGCEEIKIWRRRSGFERLKDYCQSKKR